MKGMMKKLFRNKRLLWAGGSMIGACGTAYLSARAQKNADEILAQYEGFEGETLDFKRKFSLTWKCYIPAGIGLGLTLFCSGKQYNLGSKEIAALGGSVALLAASKNELENAIREKYGEDALAEVKEAIRFSDKKEIVDPRTGEIKPKTPPVILCPEDTGRGDEVFIEEGFGRVFRSSRSAVLNGIGLFNGQLLELMNDEFGEVGALSYNDFYCCLDLDEVDYGEDYIWYRDQTGTNFGEHGVEFVLSEPEYVERYGMTITWIRNFKHPPYCCYSH